MVVSLEEDTAGRNGCLCQRSARSMSDGEIKRAVSTTTVGGERVEGDLHSTIGGGEGGRTLASAIGSAILTARSSHVCENQTPLQTPLQGDCPRGVNGEVCIGTRCDDSTMGENIHGHTHM